MSKKLINMMNIFRQLILKLKNKKLIIVIVLLLIFSGIIITGGFIHQAQAVIQDAAGPPDPKDAAEINTTKTSSPGKGGLLETWAGNTLSNLINLVVGGILAIIAYIISWLVGLAVGVLVVVAQYQDFLSEQPVMIGWRAVRDICYMFFVVVMLLIAFGTMLNIEAYHYKKLLPKMILMAILVTFSKSIAGFFIDISNVAMMGFVYSFASIAGPDLMGKLGVFKAFSSAASSPLETISDAYSGQNTVLNQQNLNLASSIGGMTLGVILLIVALGTVVIMTLVLVYRIVMIWILVILSPGAYLLAVFPGGQKYSEQWWDLFTRYLIVGPAMAFFMWLSLATLDDVSYSYTAAEIATGSEGGVPSTSEAGKTENIYRFTVAICLLLGGLSVTQQLGVGGGKMASGFVGKLAAFGTGAVLGGLAVMKWAGKGTLSEVASQVGAPTWTQIKEGWSKGVEKREGDRTRRRDSRRQWIARQGSRKWGGLSGQHDEAIEKRIAAALYPADLGKYLSASGIAKFTAGQGFSVFGHGLGERAAEAKRKKAIDQEKKDRGINEELIQNSTSEDFVEKHEKLIKDSDEIIESGEKELLKLDLEINKEEREVQPKEFKGLLEIKEREQTEMYKQAIKDKLEGTPEQGKANNALDKREKALKDLSTAKTKKEIDKAKSELDSANTSIEAQFVASQNEDFIKNQKKEVVDRYDSRVNTVKNNLDEKKNDRAELSAKIAEQKKKRNEAEAIVGTEDKRKEWTPERWDQLRADARKSKQEEIDKKREEADQIEKSTKDSRNNPKNPAEYGKDDKENKVINGLANDELVNLDKKMIQYLAKIAQKKQQMAPFEENWDTGNDEYKKLFGELGDLEKQLKNTNEKKGKLKNGFYTEELIAKVDASGIVKNLRAEADQIQKALDKPVATVEEIEAAEAKWRQSKKELDKANADYKMVQAPINYEERRHHRHEIDDARKNITTDNSEELVSIFQSAVGRKQNGEAGAAMLRLAETANLNELMKAFKCRSDAQGLQDFTKKILIGKLGMTHEQAMMVANDASYKAEGVNHWMSARAMGIDEHGNYEWKKESDRLKEIAAEIAKIDPGYIVKKFNRLAYGTERYDKNDEFELGDFGAYLIGQLGGLPAAGQKDGNAIERAMGRNEFVRNVAFNVNVQSAQEKIKSSVELEYGKDSPEYQYLLKTLGRIKEYVKGGTKEDQFKQLERLIKFSEQKRKNQAGKT